VGITGRIGAGKTSVGKYLESQHGFFYVRYSQVLSDWMAQNPERKAHLQAVGWEVMAGGMQQELNDRLIGRLHSHDDYVVDGLRHPIDFENLSNAFPSSFHLLYIESSDGTRWQRLKHRYPKIEDFRRADSHPVEGNIELLRTKAFSIFKNEDSLQQLFAIVEASLGKIRPGDRL